MTSEKRTTVVDIVVLVASLWTLGQAIWGPMLLTEGSQDRGAGATYVLSALAGAAGLVGLWLVQRRRITVGRVVVALAGLMILVGPFTYASLPALPLTFAVVCGLALLAGARFINPLLPPRPRI